MSLMMVAGRDLVAVLWPEAHLPQFLCCEAAILFCAGRRVTYSARNRLTARHGLIQLPTLARRALCPSIVRQVPQATAHW
jgi:hypothetical protein